MRTILTIIITGVYSICMSNDTLSVYFETDKSIAISCVIPRDIDTTKPIIIFGYTDYVGTTKYNIKLASERVAFVSKKLRQALGVPGVLVPIGETGPVKNDLSGDAASRRVDIIYSKIQLDTVKSKTGIADSPKKEEQDLSLEEQVNGLKVDDRLTLKNINFIPGRAILQPHSKQAIEELLVIMKKNPNLRIKIEGHICCFPDPGTSDGLNFDTGEYTLSNDRAKMVFDYLINNGISKDRLAYIGYSNTRKLYPNEWNEEEELANRRVEILILAK